MTEYTYPHEFIKRMQAQLDNGFYDFLQSLQQPAPTSIRFNELKRSDVFENAEQIPWCTEGRYLSERPSFTFDPIFHAGGYYVQEASSMFIEQAWKAINITGALKVLDLCAAPGGKSTHLLSLTGEESLLVTNEIVPARNKILQQNIIKWGRPNCIITQNKPADFSALPSHFDIVLIDAPCSGEGLFRKDRDAVNEWSTENVEMCAVRQKEILEHAFTCLAPGGYLIYSTCTYEPAENDNNIEWLMDKGMQVISINTIAAGIESTKYGYQFYPHKIKGEGFYLCLLRKGESREGANKIATVHNKKVRSLYSTQYLNTTENYTEITKQDLVFALPQHVAAELFTLEKHLYIRNAGIMLGVVKGKDFLPSVDLALSTVIKSDLPAVELDYDNAITYLRCEMPKLQTEHRGWCLARYKGLNLGWMKVLDGRINNYYPKEWRILKR